MKLFLLIVISWATCITASSQTIPDSINSRLVEFSTDSARMNYLLSLSPKLIRSNPDLDNQLLQVAKELALKMSNKEKLRQIDVKLGINLIYQNQMDSARSLFTHVLEDAKEFGDSVMIATVLSEIGISYYYESDDARALEYFIDSYHVSYALQDTSRLAAITNNIGALYQALEDYESSKKYFREAIYFKELIGDTKRMASSYHNLSISFEVTGGLDSALYYQVLARQLRQKYNDTRGLAKSSLSLSIIHRKLNTIDSAIYYSREAVRIDEALADTIAMAQDLQTLAEMLYLDGRHNEAKTYLAKSLKLAKDPYVLKDVYRLGADIAEKQGNYKHAAVMRKNYSIVSDSLFTAQNEAKLQELQVSFDTELKDLKIDQLEKDRQLQALRAAQNERQQLLLIMGLITLVVVVSVIVFLYRGKIKSNHQLAKANEQLAKLNQTKDRLFSIIAHDLKSPLSSFHLITKSLTDNWDSLEKDQLKDFLVTLRDSSANVRDMMDNLLKWALAQTDQLQYEPLPTDPVDVIASVKNQLQAVATLKRMEINLHQSDPLQIEVDRAFLEIIIRNLMSNALKYSEVQKQIDVFVQENDDQGVIAIQDQGVGMDQVQINSLLNGSLVAHDIQNSSEKGTGLGLLLCKELVDRMNGKLEVQSKINEGTTFRISFPKAA